MVDRLLLHFRPLRTVEASRLIPLVYSLGIEDSSEDVVPDSWKVFDTSTSDHYDRVLLKIVTDSRNIGNDLVSVRKSNLRDLPQCGIRLLRGSRVNLRADSPFLRARKLVIGPLYGIPDPLESWRLALSSLILPWFPDQLIDGCHNSYGCV